MLKETNAKIMVVDDQPFNIKLIEGILRHQKYEVFTAENGKQALTMLESCLPDLILLDVMMPEMDGYQVTRAIKRDSKYQHIPIILLTALDDRDSRLKGLELGAEDFLTKPIDQQELMARVRNLLKLKRLSDVLRYNNQLLEQFDSLTHLPNRESFQREISLKINEGPPKKKDFSVILLQLENMKFINESLGRQYGEIVLGEMAERLSQQCQNHHFLARLGDDTFGIMTEILNPALIETLIQTIQQALKKPILLTNVEIIMTVACGIAFYSKDGSDVSTLIRHGELALEQAKQQGRSETQYYQPQMDADSYQKLTVESELSRALERNEMQLYYQPQVDLDSGMITGAEALIRWHHPIKGVLSPYFFIPIAEETRLILPIGKWVFLEAVRHIKARRGNKLFKFPISINISPLQFQQLDLKNDIEVHLKEAQIGNGQLKFELTETATFQNIDETTKKLNSLRDLEVKIILDDFGTGYSSLVYLKTLPLSCLKIDLQFVQKLPEDKNSLAIVKAIIQLAQNLDLEVVAEGVETKEQLECLKKLGCHFGQGYYFAKPIANDEFEKLIESNKGKFF